MDAWNPNWVAFAAYGGQRPQNLPAGPKTNALFMAWITEQAADFTTKTGISKETHPGEYGDLFSDWLTDAYPQPDDTEPEYHQLWEMAHPVQPDPLVAPKGPSMSKRLTVTFLVDESFINEGTTARELADDMVTDANWGDEDELSVFDAAFQEGHRVDADLVGSDRVTIEQLEALGEDGPLGGAYVVVAMDAVDLSDHDGLRKRAWLLDGFGIYAPPAPT